MKRAKLMCFVMSSILISSNLTVFATTIENEYSYEDNIEYDYEDGFDYEADREGLDIEIEDVDYENGDFVNPDDGWGVVEEENSTTNNEQDTNIKPVTPPTDNTISKPIDKNNHNSDTNIVSTNNNVRPSDSQNEIQVDDSVVSIEDYLKDLAKKEKEEIEKLKKEQEKNQNNNQDDLWGNSFDVTDDFNFSSNGGYNNSYGSNYGEPKEKKITPDKTIQFTQSLSTKYPQYFDTGFYVNDNNQATYEDIQDAIKILAFQTKSNYVEDSEKSMVIVEGVPIVIEDENDLINFSQVENSFKGDNIKMTSSPTRIEGVYNMTEVLEVTGTINVMINDKPIDLLLDPIVKDSCVLFTIRPIADGMGGKVVWDKDKGIATIVTEDKDFKYIAKQKYATINSKEYELPTAPFIDEEEERMFTTVNLLIDEMGGYSEFDTKTKTLHIYTSEFGNEIQE